MVGAIVWTFSTWSRQDVFDVPARVAEVLPGGLCKLTCATCYYSHGFVYRGPGEFEVRK